MHPATLLSISAHRKTVALHSPTHGFGSFNFGEIILAVRGQNSDQRRYVCFSETAHCYWLGIHGKDNTLRPKSEASDRGCININQKEQFLHHVMLLVCIIITYMYNATPSGDLSC